MKVASLEIEKIVSVPFTFVSEETWLNFAFLVEILSKKPDQSDEQHSLVIISKNEDTIVNNLNMFVSKIDEI